MNKKRILSFLSSGLIIGAVGSIVSCGTATQVTPLPSPNPGGSSGTGEKPTDSSQDKTMINKKAESVKFGVSDLENKFVSDVNQEMIETKFNDKVLYNVNIRQITQNNDRKSIIILYDISRKSDTLTSDPRVYVLEGFKTMPLSVEQLNQQSNDVSFVVRNIENVSSDEVTAQNMIINGVDLNKFDVNIERFSKNDRDNSLTVLYNVKEKNSALQSDSKTFVLQGFKRPSIQLARLNELASNLVFEYGLKNKVLVSQSNLDGVILPVLKDNETQIILKSITPNIDQKSVILRYQLKDSLYDDNLSAERQFVIRGFKVELLTREELEEQSALVQFSYRNISNTFADNFNLSNITHHGYDTSKVLIGISDVQIAADKTSINVSYSVIDINNQTNLIVNQSKTISGFKIPPLSIETLENLANEITVDYSNKESVLTSRMMQENITIENQNSKVVTQVLSLRASNDIHTSAFVLLRIRDINYPDIFVQRVIEIKGFKHPPTLVSTLEAQSRNVTFDYPQKENVFARDVQNGLITTGSFFKNLAIVDITRYTVNKDNKSITIFYTLNDLNSTNKSTLKTKTLTGFKSLPLSAQKITEIGRSFNYDYANKEVTLANDALLDNFVINDTLIDVRVTKKSIIVGENKTSVIITFEVSDINYPDNFIILNYKVSGFKTPPIELEKLTRLANLISPEYTNKSVTTPSSAIDTEFSFNNVSEKVNVIFQSFTPDSESLTSLSVSFKVVDVNYLSNEVTIIKKLDGFKHPPVSVEDLNTQAENVEFNYPQKSEVLAREAEKNLVIFSGNNTVLTRVSVESVSVAANNSVTISYTLNDLNSTNKSVLKQKVLSGFRPEQLATAKLKELSKLIDFNIENKVNILASSVEKENLNISGNDDELTNIEILNVSIIPNNQSVLVTFIIKDKNYLTNTFTFSKQIDGFKIPELTTEQLNTFAAAISLGYNDLSNTLVSGFNQSDLSFFNKSDQVNATYVSSAVIDDELQAINITFKVVDVNYPTIEVMITKKLDGFKHPPISVEDLNTQADTIMFEYPQKTKVFARSADVNLITSTGNNEILTTVSIVSTSILGNFISVTYTLDDLNSENKSVQKTKNLGEFKKEPLTTVELNTIATGLTLAYDGKETIISASATVDGVRVAAHDEDGIIEISAVKVGPENTQVTVEFRVKDKNYLENIITSSMVIDGFKIPELTSDELMKFGNDVVVDYSDKSTTRVESFNASNVRFSSTPIEVTTTFKSFAMVDDESDSVNVTFETADVNYPARKVEITKKISGFKLPAATKEILDAQINNRILKGVNISSVTVDNVMDTNFELFELDTKRYELVIEAKTPQTNRTSVSVTYRIKEKGETLMSEPKTVIIEGLQHSLPIGNPFVRPTNVFATSQPVENATFSVTTDSSFQVFDFMTEGAHSYRIPNPIKLRNGEVLVGSDKRIRGKEDHTQGAIDQVLKRSKDGGKTFGSGEIVAKISTPKTNDGLTIDGAFAEVLIDKNDPSKGTKLLYMFDVFAGYTGIRDLLLGTPFIKIGDEVFWKIWTRNQSTRALEPDQWLLRKVPGKDGWWRLWKITGTGRDRNNFAASDISALQATKTYIDLSYHKEERIITGQVYENVEPVELNNPSKLNTRATINSVLDSSLMANNSRYILSLNNYNFLIESFDNGKTWGNLTVTDENWRTGIENNFPFVGSGVGNGIQLKNQTNTSLNGRIIYPVYSWRAGSVQRTFYIYSDDNGKTWNKFDPVFNQQTSESTIVELPDGKLVWMMRNATAGGQGKTWVSQSTDGGTTWQNPQNSSQKLLRIAGATFSGGLFTGMDYFELQGETYYTFSAPETTDGSRKNGALYITKDWTNFDKVWQFDTSGVQDFAYSYPVVLEVGANYVDILLTYEWTEKSYLDSVVAGKQKGSGITATRFRIIKK